MAAAQVGGRGLQKVRGFWGDRKKSQSYLSSSLPIFIKCYKTFGKLILLRNYVKDFFPPLMIDPFWSMDVAIQRKKLCRYVLVHTRPGKEIIERSFVVVLAVSSLASSSWPQPTSARRMHRSSAGTRERRGRSICSDYMRAFVIFKVVQKSPNALVNGGTDLTSVT